VEQNIASNVENSLIILLPVSRNKNLSLYLGEKIRKIRVLNGYLRIQKRALSAILQCSELRDATILSVAILVLKHSVMNVNSLGKQTIY
jgi:hypothetical protein